MISVAEAKTHLNYIQSGIKIKLNDFTNDKAEVYKHKSIDRSDGCKEVSDIFTNLYTYCLTILDQKDFPGEVFASPAMFIENLFKISSWLETSQKKVLDVMAKTYDPDDDPAPLFPISETLYYISYVNGLVCHVLSQVPDKISRSTDNNPVPILNSSPSQKSELDIICGLARRFHHSVLSLKKHPHGGSLWTVDNEWDCQYLFRSILAAYFADLRVEEPNPSHGGTTSRCEFFLKDLCTMVELKYVKYEKKEKDIHSQIAVDVQQYGGNPNVKHVIFMIYDPQFKLDTAIQLEIDYSGPGHRNLSSVQVIVSPPRI